MNHTEGVIELTEPQIWTVIGVLFLLLTATLTVTTRVITVQIGSLRNEMKTEFASSRNENVSEFTGLRAEMNARFEAVNTRFESVNARIDSLDRDVQALTKRAFD